MHFSKAFAAALCLGISAATYDPVYFMGDKIPTNKPQTDAEAKYVVSNFEILLYFVSVLTGV
jgi:hypothetical protein